MVGVLDGREVVRNIELSKMQVSYFSHSYEHLIGLPFGEQWPHDLPRQQP